MQIENSVETENKPRLDLIPYAPLIEVARVMQHGVEKRDGVKNDWRSGVRWGKYFAKTMRHLLAWWLGQDNDDEHGRSHLAAAIADLLILLDCVQRGAGADDRWKPNVN